MPIVVARIHKKAPRSPDKDGFVLRYSAQIDESAVRGADIALEALDVLMGKATKAPGTYQAKYEEVRAAYEEIIGSAPKPPPKHGPVVRVMAGVAAMLLVIGMASIGTWAAIVWLIICAFKNQSGLRAMAETAVVWSIFDWRPLINRLARIARGQ